MYVLYSYISARNQLEKSLTVESLVLLNTKSTVMIIEFAMALTIVALLP